MTSVSAEADSSRKDKSNVLPDFPKPSKKRNLSGQNIDIQLSDGIGGSGSVRGK